MFESVVAFSDRLNAAFSYVSGSLDVRGDARVGDAPLDPISLGVASSSSSKLIDALDIARVANFRARLFLGPFTVAIVGEFARARRFSDDSRASSASAVARDRDSSAR